MDVKKEKTARDTTLGSVKEKSIANCRQVAKCVSRPAVV